MPERQTRRFLGIVVLLRQVDPARQRSRRLPEDVAEEWAGCPDLRPEPDAVRVESGAAPDDEWDRDGPGDDDPLPPPVTVSAVQAGALGVEGAARQAARVAVITSSPGETDAAVERAVRVTLADYGIDADAASVTVRCNRADCGEPGARVSVTVAARVELPLVPDVLSLTAVGSVPVEASATQTVSRFARAS